MEWDKGSRRQLGALLDQAPLGEYNEILEKFRLEMLAVSLLYFYGGNRSVYLYLLSSSKWWQRAPKEKGLMAFA